MGVLMGDHRGGSEEVPVGCSPCVASRRISGAGALKEVSGRLPGGAAGESVGGAAGLAPDWLRSGR